MVEFPRVIVHFFGRECRLMHQQVRWHLVSRKPFFLPTTAIGRRLSLREKVIRDIEAGVYDRPGGPSNTVRSGHGWPKTASVDAK
jgi:hypothetical protein